MNSNKRTRVIYILFSISLFAYYLHDKNSKVNNKNITINKVKIFKPKNNSKKEKKIVSIDNVEESKIKIDFTDFQYVELKEHFKDFLLKSQRIMDNDYNIDSLNNETYTDCPFDFKLNKINPLVVEKMNKYIKEDNKYDLRNLSIKFFIEDKIEFLNINQSYLSIYNDIKYYKNSIKDLKKDSVASTEFPD